MSNFIIRGGKELSGIIVVSGSKNATLPALAASLLFKDPPEFKNIPHIEDVLRMKELIGSLRETGQIDTSLVKKFRGSILAIGPHVARCGSISFPHPGGCKIGARPIDMFLHGWEAMGAKCFVPSQAERGIGLYSVEAPNGFIGCEYTFRVSTVTGTESMIMTAVLAEGITILRNCAKEPEIIYLTEFLNQNGAKISGAGTSEIIIDGRARKLLEGNISFIAPPDRIEAGSFILLGALLSPKLVIKGCILEEQKALLDVLDSAGVSISNNENEISVSRPKILKPFHIRTEEFPGFPTDLQSPATVLATQAKGESIIEETIFESRLTYVADLNRMGANIMVHSPRRAKVIGKTELHGSQLLSPDIRAGLAFIFAALIANDESVIGEIYQIDRGYERIDERLSALGADIVRK